MKLITKYDTDIHIGNGQGLVFRYYSATPFFLNETIYFPYGMGIICCKKISLDGNVSECNFAVPPEYQIVWPNEWKMFEYNGHAILSCGNQQPPTKAFPNRIVCNVFLDLDDEMKEINLPDDYEQQYSCSVPINETEDVLLSACIMKYKNSRSYQCYDYNGNLLWSEKHKAYRYTPFEEKDNCVIFGTAGHGGGLYCYKISDGFCLCEIDTKGTPSYCWHNGNIVCRNRDGALIMVNPFENCIKYEMKLESKFTENSGFYSDGRYICAVGFMKKTNSPCVYLFDTLEE